MALKIVKATSESDQSKIFNLRYEIYVEEMGRKQSFANTTNRTIKEPFDKTAHLFMAELDGQVIGTIRTNFRKDGPLECEELYDISKFGPFYPNKISMTTKLMVKQEFRNTMAASQLAMAAYQHGRESGMLIDFIDTNPHLVRLYQQIGYRFYKDNISHPDYGNVIPMVFLLDDIEYMKIIRSPFKRYARNYKNSNSTWEFFKDHFKEYAYIKPLFSIEAESLWDSFSADLHKKPSEVLSFLKGFSESESKQLLAQFDLLHYDKGDIVFQEGDESSGMFCVFEGQVEVLVERPSGKVPITILNRGEIFGELGFVAHTKRNATLAIRQPSKLLILTPKEFGKLEKNHPYLAIKLLINLFSILVTRFQEKSQALLELQTMFDSVTHKKIHK